MILGRWFIALVVGGIFASFGCQKTDTRQPIKVAGKAQGDDVKKAEKLVNKAGCLDLAAANEMLKSSDQEVSRFYTSELSLAKPGGSIGQLEILSDTKLLAQVIDADASVHGEFGNYRVKDVREGSDIFNVVNQVNCESAVTKDANGQLHEYVIESQRIKSARLILRDKANANTWKIIQFRGAKQFILQEVKPISVNVCGEKKELLVVSVSEMSIGDTARSTVQISSELGKLMVAHTDVSSTVKQIVEASEKNKGKSRNPRQVSRIGLSDVAAADGITKLKKGSIINSSCATSGTEAADKKTWSPAAK